MRVKIITAFAVALFALPLVPAPAGAVAADQYSGRSVFDVGESPGPGAALTDISPNGHVAGWATRVEDDEQVNYLLHGPHDDVQATVVPFLSGSTFNTNDTGDVTLAKYDPVHNRELAMVFDAATGTFDDRGFDDPVTVSRSIGGIGNAGEVFTVAFDATNGLLEPSVQAADGSLTFYEVPPVPDVVYAVARDFSATGWALALLASPAGVHGVRWNPAGDLVPLDGDGGSAFPIAVNDSGTTTGIIQYSTGESSPARWNPAGDVEVLDADGTPFAFGYGISNDGTVAGMLAPDPTLSTYAGARPVLWNPDGTRIEVYDRLVQDLPDDEWLALTAVNDAGVAVGLHMNEVSAAQSNGDQAWVFTPVTRTPVSVDVSGPSTVAYQGTIGLEATQLFSDNSTEPVTGSATWMSSNPSVATVSAAGLVTGVAPGQATITASYGGFEDTHVVTVTKAASTTTAHPTSRSIGGLLGTQQTITFSATVTSQVTGNPIVAAPVTFTVAGTQGCSAVTTGSGVASCTVTYSTLSPLLNWLLPNLVGPTPPAPGASYAATYGGSVNFAPSSGTNNISN